jgi:hypothetical protein
MYRGSGYAAGLTFAGYVTRISGAAVTRGAGNVTTPAANSADGSSSAAAGGSGIVIVRYKV